MWRFIPLTSLLGTDWTKHRTGFHPECSASKVLLWNAFLVLLLGCPFRGCPVVNSVFGRLCRKTVPRGGKARESGTEKRCCHKWFHMIFPCTVSRTNTFCTSSLPPQKPRRRCEPEEGYLRCSRRFDHRSHSTSFVIVGVEVTWWCWRWETQRNAHVAYKPTRRSR